MFDPQPEAEPFIVGTEDRDPDHVDLDVYHHFPEGFERLLEALVGILSSPIEVVVTSNGNPVHMVLTPQTPKENTQ